MTTAHESQNPKYPALRDLTPAGQAAANWFRLLARGLRTCRLYQSGNPIAQTTRDLIYQQLAEALKAHGNWAFRITASEIFLADEPVVHPSAGSADAGSMGKEDQLPFQFYRDGVRGLMLMPGLPRGEFDALFEALLLTGTGPQTHDDLVTLLWQANAQYLQMESVPLEQTIFLSSRRPTGGGGGGGGRQGLAYAWSPTGAEIRADIGQVIGEAQGLHRDTFDDWPLLDECVDVQQAYEKSLMAMQFARTRFITEWASERAMGCADQAPELFRLLLELDGTNGNRAVLAHSTVTWLASAVQACAWEEAQSAFGLLRDLDPDGSLSNDTLATAIAGLDSAQITEKLDESEADDQGRFFALTVGVGRPMMSLACEVMARAEKSRTRAAAVTMLCYLCSDNPELLAPYLTDSRWYVVRNTVFVLGQIGGDDVVGLLKAAAVHPEPRVRRQVVQSLGAVSLDARRPILVEQLDTRDAQLLAAALNMLTRQKDPRVAQAILKQIEAPDFESRSEENQRALFGALAEVATDDSVPALEALLHRGGWFARRTLQRTAAARTLQRLGTEKATAALQAGLRSRSEAVRQACLEAFTMKTT
jgi:hypothetical protein